MALDLQQDAIVSTVSVPAAQPGRLDAVRGAIPDSGNVSGIEVRLAQLHVKDNHTPRIPPFPGYADLYLLIIVVDDQMPEPRTLTLNSFAHVDDNEDLPVDRTVYYWKQEQPAQKPPCQVHVLVSVLKSKKGLRDTGQVLAAAQTNDSYKSLLQQVTAAIAKAPAQTASLILQLGNVIGAALTDVEDKTLFTQVVSFTDINGDFDTLGKTPHTQENRYVASTLSIIVRDVAREQALAALAPAAQPPLKAVVAEGAAEILLTVWLRTSERVWVSRKSPISRPALSGVHLSTHFCRFVVSFGRAASTSSVGPKQKFINPLLVTYNYGC